MFDPERHRDIASFGETPDRRAGPGLTPGLVPQGFDFGDGHGDSDADNRTCHIVFPALYSSIARWPPSDASKSGVIVY